MRVEIDIVSTADIGSSMGFYSVSVGNGKGVAFEQKLIWDRGDPLMPDRYQAFERAVAAVQGIRLMVNLTPTARIANGPEITALIDGHREIARRAA